MELGCKQASLDGVGSGHRSSGRKSGAQDRGNNGEAERGQPKTLHGLGEGCGGGRGDAEHREREAPGSLDKEEGGGSNQDQAQGQL